MVTMEPKILLLLFDDFYSHISVFCKARLLFLQARIIILLEVQFLLTQYGNEGSVQSLSTMQPAIRFREIKYTLKKVLIFDFFRNQ